MKETMKACISCGNTGQIAYCPDCGELMRDILIDANGELFVVLSEEEKTRLLGVVGFHVRCKGLVKRHKSSKPNTNVFSCEKCHLRIIGSDFYISENSGLDGYSDRRLKSGIKYV